MNDLGNIFVLIVESIDQPGPFWIMYGPMTWIAPVGTDVPFGYKAKTVSVPAIPELI